MENRARLMVVDDQRDLLEPLGELLKGEFGPSIDVLAYDNFTCAETALCKMSPALVITDLQYSYPHNNLGLGGKELAQLIWSQFPHIPVIMLTGSDGTIVKSLRNEDSRFASIPILEKPVDASVILNLVRERLGISLPETPAPNPTMPHPKRAPR